MKKITSIAILLMLVMTRMPAQDVIVIEYNGSTATVTVPDNIPDVIPVVNGTNVTIISNTTQKEYTYQVKGASTDGSLIINGSYKLTLQLAGVTLTNAHGGAVIDVECGKRIAVELADGTVNTLSDAAMGSQKAAFYIDGHAEFKGGGTLNVYGKLKHAIRAKEYVELKGSTGTINVLGAVSDGIHCGKGKVNNENNYFLMKGGIVNVFNVGGDGIDSDDYGVIRIEGGTLSLNIKDGDGLKADSTVTINGGKINISVKGEDCKGIRANYAVNIAGGKTNIIVEGDGSKGIKAKRYESGSTVLNGGELNISGGEISVQCNGKNLYTESDITKCVAVSVDTDLKQTAGDVYIIVFDEALAYTLGGETYQGSETHTGGTFNIRQVPWQVKTKDCQYDMTAYVVVSNNDERLTNYDAVSIGAFIGDECVGYGIFDEEDYGVIRIKGNDDALAQSVTFKLYSFSDQSEYNLTPNETVTFQENASMGEPSNPIVLNYKMKLNGDANDDGEVNAEDIVAITNYIAGKDGDVTEENADVNGDGVVNIADIIAVTHIILGN
ncbi:MAG: carbohydrate-binding domain-containing protein [Prevotella sp.]|nr:carbohydrate-binding domain-containing protein [Prevotella sp.]